VTELATDGQTAKDPGQFPLLRNLQFSPIKEKEEQYVVLWDPTRLTDEKLIVPLHYFYLLQFFDGEHSLDQIAAEYLRKFGEFFMPDRLAQLVADLDSRLFLEGERVEEAKRAAVAAYRQAARRAAAFSSRSYEGEREKLQAQLDGFFSSPEGPPIKASEHRGKAIAGLVAPHYELRLGGPVYAWAYKELKEADRPDLFVVLGTCHAGLKNLFAATDKDFETPFGTVPVARDVLDRFRQGGERFFEEDAAHRGEHTIEFQLPFLQHAMGDTPFSIVPALCAFPPSAFFAPQLRGLGVLVEEFIERLQAAIAGTGRRACVIASADLAHIGMRYGDSQPPTDFSFHRCMQADLEMLKHVEELKPEAFAEFIHKEEDARRICGFGPIYTLLKLIRAEKGQVLRYDRGVTDQFNSTVTFASMSFF
jgi:AmmeMemoRadiSam system protein B